MSSLGHSYNVHAIGPSSVYLIFNKLAIVNNVLKYDIVDGQFDRHAINTMALTFPMADRNIERRLHFMTYIFILRNDYGVDIVERVNLLRTFMQFRNRKTSIVLFMWFFVYDAHDQKILV